MNGSIDVIKSAKIRHSIDSLEHSQNSFLNDGYALNVRDCTSGRAFVHCIVKCSSHQVDGMVLQFVAYKKNFIEWMVRTVHI